MLEPDVVEDEEGGEEEDEDDSDDEDNVVVTINQDKIEEAKTTLTDLRITKTARQIPSEKKGKFKKENWQHKISC